MYCKIPFTPKVKWISLKVRSHQTRMTHYSREVGRLNILSLLASFAREICFIRVWNSLHNRREYTSWEGLLPGSSSLLAKCIPVFVRVRRCIYSSGYPHTTTITLSSIVVSDFLPPLVMTSLLEQAPDWLTRREYPPKFRFFNSRQTLNSRRAIRAIRAALFARIAPQDCLSRLCIDLTCKPFASFASGVNAPSRRELNVWRAIRANSVQCMQKVIYKYTILFIIYFW